MPRGVLALALTGMSAGKVKHMIGFGHPVLHLLNRHFRVELKAVDFRAHAHGLIRKDGTAQQQFRARRQIETLYMPMVNGQVIGDKGAGPAILDLGKTDFV